MRLASDSPGALEFASKTVDSRLGDLSFAEDARRHRAQSPGLPNNSPTTEYHHCMEQQLICGYPDQWKAFQQRNEKFLERLNNVQVALNLTFLRTFSSSGPEDRTIFTMGRLCSEEFYEITLLATNGYGFGALRLLRSLYERAVTMAFLSENSAEVDAFLNYHAVAQFKLLRVMQESFGVDVLPTEVVEKTERDYAGVKAHYEVTACSKWHEAGQPHMAQARRRIDGKENYLCATDCARVLLPDESCPQHCARAAIASRADRWRRNGFLSPICSPRRPTRR